jgi:flagellar basal-body rod protein FlgG
MLSMLGVASAGALAQQRALDVTGNNLSNLGTNGFKSRRADFEDLPPAERIFAVSPDDSPADREVGQGVQLAGIATNQAIGGFQATGQPLDLAIQGEGWLQVQLPDGRAGYTRDGALRLDQGGRLVTQTGDQVAPGITVPPGAIGVYVQDNGKVVARLGDQQEQELGQLQLARFSNPDGLESAGRNLLVATAASGGPILGLPGENGFGKLQNGGVEGSNVQIGDELVRVIQAQRAYQVNLRQIHTIDEMLQTANNLRNH